MLTWQHWSERLHCVLHCPQGIVVRCIKIKSKVGCTQVYVLETSDMLCGKHGGYVHPFSVKDFYISIVFLAFGHIGKCVCYLFLQFPVTFFNFLLPAFLPSYFWCIFLQICPRWVTGTKEKHVQIVQYSLRPHSGTLGLVLFICSSIQSHM